MKVLVLGDFIYDMWVEGKWTRINPEDDVPIFGVDKVIVNAGGAGNVAVNLEILGLNVITLARGKSQKTRVMKDGHQLFRIDRDFIDKPIRIDGIFASNDYLSTVEAVVISDYNKGAIAVDDTGVLNVKGLIDKAFNLEIPVFIDTKKNPIEFGGYENIIMFPNVKELTEYPEFQIYSRVEKHGPAGLKVVDVQTGKINTHKGIEVPVKSVAGAGDVVLAAFVRMYLQTGGDMEQAGNYANAMAALAIQKLYTCRVNTEDVYAGGV